MQKARGQDIVRLRLGGPEDDRSSLRSILAAIALPAAAALALPGVTLVTRGALAIGIVTLALAGLALRPRPKRQPKRWITVEPTRVTRRDENGETELASFDSPFGLTILANQARTRALLAFTARERTRYVRVRIRGTEDAARARELLTRASTVTEADVLLGAGDEGDALSASAAARFVELVAARAPGALDRCFLTDAQGTAVTLDGDELRLGERVVDLRAPLEWRGFMFHESLGQMTTIYQATWLRQAQTEAILVSPLPTEVTSWMVGRAPRQVGAITRDALVQRALVRDMRLMHSVPDAPPPRDQRVAIERLFMLPLRRALDRAPRLARASVPPSLAAPRRDVGL
jgi:hypothetical protein